MKSNSNWSVSLLVFAMVVFVGLGCNMGKYFRSANTSESGPADNKPGGPPGAISGECNNPYYPVAQGMTRKYHVKYPNGMVSDRDYTESFSDFSGDTFTVNSDFQTVAAHIRWKCTADGLLATQFNNSIDLKDTGRSVTVETVDSKGVTFPKADKWQSGGKWSAEYHILETIRIADGKPSISAAGTVQQDSEVFGTEEITVPAGTFQAVKAKITSHLKLDMTTPGGGSHPIETSIETTVWMVRDTGMVRSVTGIGQGGDVTTELTSVSK